MDDIDIIVAFYETIKDSMEWAVVNEGREYAYFVDGAVAMTKKMINMYSNMPQE